MAKANSTGRRSMSSTLLVSSGSPSRQHLLVSACTLSATETIGKGLGLPAKSVPEEQATDHFTWLSMFMGINMPATAKITKETVGWEPKKIGLIRDVETGCYFKQ